MKTTGVKALVREVLGTIPAPYSEHVIDDVFHAIEANEGLVRKYKALCDELGKSVVNNWCGQWTANALGKRGEVQVTSRKSTLISSYSLLDTDAKSVLRRPGEEEARQLMADYYWANKNSISTDVRKHREMIIELIMDGTPVAEAFTLAQQHSVNT